jgi:hypothetical protein
MTPEFLKINATMPGWKGTQEGLLNRKDYTLPSASNYIAKKSKWLKAKLNSLASSNCSKILRKILTALPQLAKGMERFILLIKKKLNSAVFFQSTNLRLCRKELIECALCVCRYTISLIVSLILFLRS